jgi:hypothetical protein
MTFLSSCSLFQKDPGISVIPEDSQLAEQLRQKVNLYCELGYQVADSEGFYHSTGDGLLFTAIHETVCGGSETLKAEVAPGAWCRHPSCPGSSPAFEISPSRLSRDMLLGLLVYANQYEKIEHLDRLIRFGLDHAWDMCDGHYRSNKERIGRCILSPTLRATVYDVAVELGYPCDDTCKLYRSVFQVWDPFSQGYRAHLTVLHTDLRGRVEGGINKLQKDFLRAMAEREPNNALYVAMHRSYTGQDLKDVAWYLMNSPRWPNNRLPTNNEYCTEYLFQRDEQKENQEFTADSEGCVTYYEYRGRDNYEQKKECGIQPNQPHIIEGMSVNDDWYSCAEAKTHSGTDFLFAAFKVLGGLRGTDR